MCENFPRPRPVLERKNPRSSRELWASDFSPHGARSDANFRIVFDSFVLPGVAAGHHIKLVIFLAEPDRGVDSIAVLAEGGKRHIFLAFDLRGNRHKDIVRRLNVWRGALARVTAAPVNSRKPHGLSHRLSQNWLQYKLAAFAGGGARGTPDCFLDSSRT